MSTQPAADHKTSGIRPASWSVLAAVVIAVGLLLHALLPRYTLTPVGPDGAVVVFDRWTGQFQRASYGPDGEPRVSAVVKPF